MAVVVQCWANVPAVECPWLIILGVRNDGLGVTCSMWSIWNIGFSTTGTCFGILLALYLSALRSSFNFFASSLFFCLVFLSLLEFIFLTLFWPPSESAIGGENSLPPSVFIIGVGIMPVVLFHVTCAFTLGVDHMLARVVGVDDVCALCCTFVSRFSVALLKVFC